MTTQERAEKIAGFVYAQTDRDGEWLDRNLAIEQIAAQIEEAEREAKDWCMMQHAKLRRETWFTDGFHAARDKAAEEADEHNGCIDPECLKRDGQCGVVIAERVRRMEP